MSAKIEIDVEVMRKNIEIIKSKGEVIYVAKAGAYGLGEKYVIPHIDKYVSGYAVSSEAEAVKLSKFTKKNILILLPVKDFDCIEGLNVAVSVWSEREAKLAKNRNLLAHLKVNSGMNRFGVDEKEDTIRIAEILGDNLVGAFTHLSSGDEEFCCRQLEKFDKITRDLDVKRHVTLNQYSFSANLNYDFRSGLDVLGVRFSKGEMGGFSSAIKVKSEIIGIRNVEKGENVGYNFGFSASEKMKIGIVGLGYADLAMRRQSNCGKVLVNGRFCDIIGYICMDVLFCRLDFGEVEIGDEVIVIDNDFDQISWNTVAKRCETISYELLTSINERAERVVLHGDKS